MSQRPTEYINKTSESMTPSEIRELKSYISKLEGDIATLSIQNFDKMTKEFIDWRHIEEQCGECSGSGLKLYGSSAIWHTEPGIISTNAFTMGLCDRCWGSGDESNPWTHPYKTCEGKIKILDSEEHELEFGTIFDYNRGYTFIVFDKEG